MNSFRTSCEKALAQHGAGIVVTVVSTEGSAPREVGAQLFVSAAGIAGSIGGGTLEWRAMAEAQAMLAKGHNTKSLSYSLGPELGQCCGGRVVLSLQRVSRPAELDNLITPAQKRAVLLFGAGHVGRALVMALAPGPFLITWVDPRPNAFPSAVPGDVSLVNGEPLTALSRVTSQSFAVVMSHSHALDFDIVDAALRRPEIERVLLIGSATKRARFVSRLRGAGHGDATLLRLICPIGQGLRSKSPYAIALSTAYQLLSLDEALQQPLGILPEARKA